MATEHIDRVLALLASPAAPQIPLDTAERRLGALFGRLQASDDTLERAESEDLIWALWCLHSSRDAERRMQQLIGAMARGDRARARALSEALVRDFPDWPEAWNKRATLAFIEDRNADSVADIERTLVLEPRHFGAVCGFAQIAERQGHTVAALLAYEYAAKLNPNLETVRLRAAQLRQRDARVLH